MRTILLFPLLALRLMAGVAIVGFCLRSISVSLALIGRRPASCCGAVDDEVVLASSLPRTLVSSSSSSLLVPLEPDPAVAQRLASHIPASVNTGTWSSPLEHCPVTSQVRIVQTQPFWTLLALDENGRAKAVGGDEFYVTYTQADAADDDQQHNDNHHNKATAVALLRDHRNGTYQLDFVTTPMNPTPTMLLNRTGGRGNLTVHFQYTCGIGLVAQPGKQHWKTGGATMVTHTATNVTQPPVRIFQPPSQGNIDFTPFDLVVSFGDSLMKQLVQFINRRTFYRRDGKVTYHRNILQELSGRTLPDVVQKLDEWHSNDLNQTQSQKKVALVLGSAVWDIAEHHNLQGPEFEDHLQAARGLIAHVRDTYPHVSLFWKSPSALHVHTAQCKMAKCWERVRYFSNARARHLHDLQKRLMRDELRVPVLDLYEAYYLSGDWTIYGDARHYDIRLCRRMLDWFYRDDKEEDDADADDSMLDNNNQTA